MIHEIDHGRGSAFGEQEQLVEVGAVHLRERFLADPAAENGEVEHLYAQLAPVGVAEAELGDLSTFDHDEA
ncbi:hypothetical protein [Lentzea aerocolonigenes]|uniref:hypothetical protein n=1 Tax=Lentzea aerocolonigenes TaxID=68170 RepID=UPI00191BED9E|nr:hypothetical protein [Lentzea aerocolonigenes]